MDDSGHDVRRQHTISYMYAIRTCESFRCYSESEEIRWNTEGTITFFIIFETTGNIHINKWVAIPMHYKD